MPNIFSKLMTKQKFLTNKAFVLAAAIFLIGGFFVANNASAATITSAGDGNWNSTTTNAPWPGGVVPSSTDDVVIRPGDDITVTANATINSIVFNNTANNNSIFTVNAGVIFTVTTSITLRNNGANIDTRATITGAGTINSASVQVAGTTAITNDTDTTLTSTISTLSISGDLTINGKHDSSDENDAFFLLGSGTVNVGGTVTLISEDDGTAGSGDATLDLDAGAQTGTLNLTGATPFSISGTGTETTDFNGNNATVKYSGATQSVLDTTYTNLTLSGSGTKTPVAGFTVNTNLTIDSGVTLDVAGFTISLSSATLTVNGTLDFSNASGIVKNSSGTSILTMGANGLIRTIDSNGLGPVANASLQNNGTFTTTSLNTNGTIEYNRTSAQTITSRNYNNLILSGSGAKTMSSGTSVGGTLSIPAAGAKALVTTGQDLTVANLTLGSLGRINGTWGFTGSGATHIDTTYFITGGTGTLNVTNDTRATPTATLAVTNPPVTYNGSPQAATVTVTVSSVPGAVSNILAGGTATKTNAGTYAVTADFIPTDTTSYNSLTGVAAGDFIINKATPTLSVTNSPITYDGTPKAATVSGSVPGIPSNILTGDSATQTDADTYAVTADFAPTDTTNYESLIGASAGDFIINKADAIISITPYSVTYDGAPYTAVGSATGVLAEDLSGLLDLSGTTHTDAGTYSNDPWFFAGDTNYNDAGSTVADAIGKADATVNVTGYTGTYDGNSHGANGTATGVNAEDLSGSLDLGSSFTDVPGGTADWTFNGGTNYNNQNDSVPIEILALNLTASASGNGKVYDTTTNASTAVVLSTDALEGDDVTAHGTASFEDPNVGTDKPVHVTGIYIDGAAAGNYNLTNETAETTANITQEAGTITLDTGNLTRTYNNTPQSVDVTGTTPESLSYSVTYDGLETPPTAAGTYDVHAAITDPNYAGSADQTLIINPAPLTITPNNQAKTYGDTFTFTGTEFSSDGLVPEDSITSVTLTSDGAAASAEVSGSPYSITASDAIGTGLDNYDITYSEGSTLTVDKAALTVTPDDKVKIQGTEFTAFTGVISGIKNEDNITATYASDGAGADALVDNYDITVVTPLNDPDEKLGNYDEPTLNIGTLTVNAHIITASAGDHGSISPSGGVGVADGASQSFTITPSEDYHVADVLVDGESVGAVTSYEFTNVTANHTISASFAQDTTRTITTADEDDTTTTATETGNVTVNIPASTDVTGPIDWNGIITDPAVTTTYTAPTPDSGFDSATPVIALEMGAGDKPLTFSKAVKITFAGQADKYVGWSRGGVFTQITNICSANDQATMDSELNPDKDCKISNDGSGNLVVWTRHFTVFVTYTQTATSAPAPTAVIGGTVVLPPSNAYANWLAQQPGQVLGIKIENTETTGNAVNLTDEQLNQILIDAAAIWSENRDTILANASSSKDANKEKGNLGRYISSIIKAIKNLTAKDNNRLNYFITYGTKSAKILGEGERAGALNSYKSAFGKLPKTEADWQDILKIANGRWPSATSTTAEAKAKVEFKKVYGREADLSNARDGMAIKIIAYGLRPAKRNLNSENAAIKSFKAYYRHAPISTLAWDIVRAIAYSGAKR